MPNNSNILVGAPSQTAASGAIRRAPVGTAGPTNATTAMPDTWTAGGYVDENGLGLSASVSTTDIKEWGGSIVRRLVEEFTGEITFTYLEFGDPESLKQQYGDGYVTTTDKGIKVSLGNHLGDIQSWAIDIKDGDNAVRIYIPKGQVTANGDISFVNNDAIKSQTTLTCYDDGSGNSLYLFIDGKVVSL